MTEEDLEKVTPEMEEELLDATAEIGNYRLVAEVVSAKYCFAGLQPGQKYVVDSAVQLNPQESTAPLCLGALAELVGRGHTLLDRIYQKGDITLFTCQDSVARIPASISVDWARSSSR